MQVIGAPVVANNSSFVEFTGLDATYSAHRVTFCAAVPASDGAKLRARTNGDSGASDYKPELLTLYGTNAPVTVHPATERSPRKA